MQRKKEAKKRKLVQKDPVKLMKLKKARLSNGDEDYQINFEIFLVIKIK